MQRKVLVGLKSSFQIRKTSLPNESSIELARKQFTELAKRLKISKPEDWYKISTDALKSNINETLMLTSLRSTSLIDALRLVYPEVNWDPIKFERRYKFQQRAPNQ